MNQTTPFTPRSILTVVAHADDSEFCVGGSIARWISEGAEVSYLVLTDGRGGSNDRSRKTHDIIETRRREQRAAAKLLGVKQVIFCDYEDGQLAATNNVKRDIVRAIRKVRPDTVITIDPTMVYSISRGEINHTDHRAAGLAAVDAVFPLARDYLSFPELADKEKLEPHKVATLLLINYDKANFYVDITDTMDKKIQALGAHVSQFQDADAIEQIVRKHAENAGREYNCQYAEAYIKLDIPQ